MFDDRTAAYFQGQAVEWGPKILVAILILAITWFVARAVKAVLHKSSQRVPALEKQSGSKPGESVGYQLGTVASLIVWLVGIMAALSFLGIGQILQPVATLTTGIFEFLPRLIGAGLIFFVGLIVARIARQLVEAIVEAANLEGLTGKLGIPGAGESLAAAGATGKSAGSAKASIARAAGIVVFALVIIPVAIAALQVLQIDAISRPAIGMLNQILAAIPHILSAALWIGIAFLAGRLLKSVIEGVLPATGFDAALRSTGIVPASVMPSRVVGNIALAAIVLSAGIEAARQLGGTAIAGFLGEITALGGRVLFGSLIIAAGVFVARFVSGLVSSGGEGAFGRTLMRYGIIALASAIGLRFMGLANEIVILAFGLILGSAALASALAFGLGGRRPAERVLDSYASRALAEDGSPIAFSFGEPPDSSSDELAEPTSHV
jgi:Mechanosensitive ion channel, conserved TM helix